MTSIGQSLTIRGELTSDEDVAISGRMLGPILVRNGSLHVRSTARVDGDIRAARVVVEGQVDGNLASSERIDLQATARVTGSLSARTIRMAEGATFTGRVEMDRAGGAPGARPAS